MKRVILLAFGLLMTSVTVADAQRRPRVCEPGTRIICITGLCGICAIGVQRCASDGRSWSVCLPVDAPVVDVCDDGLDNDCDCTVDEGCR